MGLCYNTAGKACESSASLSKHVAALLEDIRLSSELGAILRGKENAESEWKSQILE